MPPPAIDEAAARVQAGCPTGRTGAGIPGRFGIRTQRSSDPQRSVSDESPRRAAIPATRRKTREKKQDEFPGHCIIRPETYRAPGDRTGNAAGERAERPQVRERGRLVRPVSGLRKIGPSRQKRRTNPEYLSNTLLHQNPKYKRGVHSYESYRNSARGGRNPRARVASRCAGILLRKLLTEIVRQIGSAGPIRTGQRIAILIRRAAGAPFPARRTCTGETGARRGRCRIGRGRGHPSRLADLRPSSSRARTGGSCSSRAASPTDLSC